MIRIRIRFSLRVFLAVLTIGAVLLGAKVRQAYLHASASHKLTRQGMSIWDMSWRDDHHPPKWLPAWAHDHWHFLFPYPVGVLNEKQDAPAKSKGQGYVHVDLTPLSNIKNIERLLLAFAAYSNDDLALLTRLTTLKELCLRYIAVDDQGLKHVGRLQSLERLNLLNLL